MLHKKWSWCQRNNPLVVVVVGDVVVTHSIENWSCPRNHLFNVGDDAGVVQELILISLL